MKPKNNAAQHLLLTRFIALSFGLSVAGLSTQSSQAVTQTWSGTNSGVWDTSALNWDSGAAAWTSSNDALFTGTPTNNVTTATGLTIGAITLENTFTGSVTMSGSNTVSGATTISAGTLNLNNATGLGTSAVTVNGGGTAAINLGTGAATVANAFSGAGILKTTLPSGANSLTLSGDLSGFTGTLNVGIGSGGGKLVFSNATQAPSSSATINVATNGTIYVFNALNYGSSLSLNGGTTGEALGQLRIEGGANWTGGVTLKANSTIGANTGTATISGAIGENGGSFGFTKLGNGTTVISGNNNYSGTATISGGTLSVGHNSALGTGSVAFNGGTLANTTGVTLANNLSTASANGTITSSGGTMVLNGNITGNRGLTLTPTHKITLAGTNSFATATGGTNTFYALIVNGGAGGVDITGSTTVGTVGAGGSSINGAFAMTGTSTVTIQSGGSLTVNGSGTTASNIPNSIVGQNAAFTSTVLVNGGSLVIGADTGFVLGNGNNNNIAANGVLTISSGTATINRGTVATTGNGTDTRLIMMGRDSNSATGTVNLNGGTLATDRQFVRDGSSTGQAGTANFVFGGGTLKALGNQTDWLQSTTASSAGQNQGTTGGTVNGSAQALSSVTTTAVSTINANGFSVAINNAISGAGGFNIDSSTGAGTVTFGGANTYTGKTTVTNGTLALGAGGSIADSSEIALNGGNFNVSAVAGYSTDASQALTGSGSITGDITVTGTLAIGNSPGTMTFNDDLTIGTSAVSNFELTNIAFGLGTYDLAQSGVGTQAVTFGGTLNLLFSGGTYANNSSVQIFDFENYSGVFTTVNFSGLGVGQSATFNATTGFVTVIPEPQAALLGGLGMLVLLRRRRI